jgi:hypothetical protein
MRTWYQLDIGKMVIGRSALMKKNLPIFSINNNLDPSLLRLRTNPYQVRMKLLKRKYVVFRQRRQRL